MLVDHTDALFFRRKLITDKGAPSIPITDREVRVALYSPHIGWIQQGADPFPPEIETQEQFLRLLLQARFLDGQIDYSPKMLELMEQWLLQPHDNTTRARELYQLFSNVILKYKTEQYKLFKHSQLRQLFERLCPSSADQP